MDFTLELEKGLRNLSTNGAFLTVTDAEGHTNTMTISWGFVGFLWQKPHFITVVRPQRYTYELLKTAVDFTVSIPFDGALKNELALCGSRSGRDVDKSKIVSFIAAKKTVTPVVEGCGLYYECAIDYRQAMEGANMPDAVVKSFFKAKDFHTMFFGKITDCYLK